MSQLLQSVKNLNKFGYYTKMTSKNFDSNKLNNLLSPNTNLDSFSKNKLTRYNTKNDADIDMIEMVSDLQSLSISKHDLRKIDEEISKVSSSESYDMNKSSKHNTKDSKVKSSLRSAIHHNSKAQSIVKPLDMSNRILSHYNKSSTHSLSSISCQSSINVDPDEKRPRIVKETTSKL